MSLRRLVIKNSPFIFTSLATIGVVVTAIFASKDTIKNFEENENRRFQTLKCYIPTITIGLITISCIISAHALNKKQQTALISAYIFLNKAYQEYKKKSNEIFGENASDQIRNEVVKERYLKLDEKEGNNICKTNEKELFYEEYYGKFFERTKEEVLNAEWHCNRDFILKGYASLNDFYEYLDLEPTEFGNVVGWGIDVGHEIYGYSWIDFNHELVTTADNELEYNFITMTYPPTTNYI